MSSESDEDVHQQCISRRPLASGAKGTEGDSEQSGAGSANVRDWPVPRDLDEARQVISDMTETLQEQAAEVRRLREEMAANQACYEANLTEVVDEYLRDRTALREENVRLKAEREPALVVDGVPLPRGSALSYSAEAVDALLEAFDSAVGTSRRHQDELRPHIEAVRASREPK